jgi:hypothetical protein
MSANSEESMKLPEFRTGPLITSAALVGAGTIVALVGLAVGGSHLFQATRRWIQAMEVPPTEVVRLTWLQPKPVAAAGSSSWRNVVTAGADS